MFLFNLIIEQGMLVMITEATTDCHENDAKEKVILNTEFRKTENYGGKQCNVKETRVAEKDIGISNIQSSTCVFSLLLAMCL